jgi:hypothetical protein
MMNKLFEEVAKIANVQPIIIFTTDENKGIYESLHEKYGASIQVMRINSEQLALNARTE